jgi:hypothetical protein
MDAINGHIYMYMCVSVFASINGVHYLRPLMTALMTSINGVQCVCVWECIPMLIFQVES